MGIQIYPDEAMQQTGHALTVWGDDGASPEPQWIWVTDSDRDQGALNIDSYDWTVHPDARGAGNDLYSLDYWDSADSGYLGYVVTLCPVPEASVLILFGSGLAGMLGFCRRRLFQKHTNA